MASNCQFLNTNRNPVDLSNLYNGRSAFLICGGPSFAKMPNRVRRILSRPGFLTMGVNNAPKLFRPNLWTSVDEPDHFMRSIFLDAKIIKFLPCGKLQKNLWNNDEWQPMDVKTGDCPSVYYYHLTHDGYPDQFLSHPGFYWGGTKREKTKEGEPPDDRPEVEVGGRSVMHVAIKLLYVLGIKRVFLLGADFHMSETNQYGFEQKRAGGSIKGNNSTYAKMNERFKVLRPQFEAAGFYVYNCTPGSQLEAFERMDFMAAADMVQDDFGVNTKVERTYGLYERSACEKNCEKWRKKTDDRIADLGQHWLKMVNNPGKEKFSNRFDRKLQKMWDAYHRMIAFENERVELECWKGSKDGK